MGGGDNPYKGWKGGRSPSSFRLLDQGPWPPLPPKKGGGRVLTALNTGFTYVGIYIMKLSVLGECAHKNRCNRSGRGLIIGLVGEGGE